jgi:transcriptional regulator with XRE-family HTH domain
MDGKEIRDLFSANLKFFRARAGISQLNLGTELGMAPNFISDIECGKKWISPETLSKLAEALHVEPYQFFMQNHGISDDTATLLRSFTDDLTQSIRSTAETMRDRYLDSK